MTLAELIADNVATVLMFLITLAVLLLYQNTRRPPGFPPGPPALPIIGNILTFRSSEPTYQIFLRLTEKYGRIFSLKLGSFWVIVLNDIEDIREALVKHPIDFAGRPNLYSTSLFTQGFQDITFSNYSPEWNLHRRIGHAAVRHFAHGEKLNKLVHDVLPSIAKVLDRSAGKPFDPKALLDRSIYIVLANMCFGKDHDFDDPILAKWFNTNNQVIDVLGVGLNPWDLIHCLKYLPLLPRERRKNELANEEFQYIYDEFKGHRETFDPGNIRDVFDLLIAAQKKDAAEGRSSANFLTDTRVAQSIRDMFGAGTGTTIPTLYWAIAIMLEHPQVLERVTKEIDEVIGQDRLPCVSDRSSMPYTEATLMEVNRYAVVAPIGLPKSVTRDTTLRAYKIPKDTLVIINIWAAHYDHDHWDEPFKFKPERFLDDSGTRLLKAPPSFMPFSLGRRSCIGKDFAQGEIFILFCWLFGHYSISKAPAKKDVSLLKLDKSTGLNHEPAPFEIVVTKK